MGSTILVIDDEPQIRRVVRNALSPGMRVLDAATGRAGIDLAAAERPALIVLDLGLPDIPGASVCHEIRKWSTAPIIVLSARHLDTEKVALLDAGADDYITKPFSLTELQARVRAQLRRAQLAEARPTRVRSTSAILRSMWQTERCRGAANACISRPRSGTWSARSSSTPVAR